MDYHVRKLRRLRLFREIGEKKPLLDGTQAPGTDQCLLNWQKSASEGLKERNRGACRIIPADMKVKFEIAEKTDAPELTRVSVRAFHTDFTKAGRSAIGGPPGYDNLEFHEQMIVEAAAFFKILLDDEPRPNRPGITGHDNRLLPKQASSPPESITGQADSRPKHIIGGFWFIRENEAEAYLYRIFVDPRFHRHGVGLRALDFLFQSFPHIKGWTLKIPIWNSRTPEFYKKIGFQEKERSDRFIYLNKKME